MALMQITIIPIGTTTPSVGEYVADTQELLKNEALEYVLNDMGTVVYGETPQLLDIASAIHALPFKKGAKRVVTNIVIDERTDLKPHVGEKHESVLNILKQRTHEG